MSARRIPRVTPAARAAASVLVILGFTVPTVAACSGMPGQTEQMDEEEGNETGVEEESGGDAEEEEPEPDVEE